MTDKLFQTLDIVCYSHLRWNFVFQRPQHLMSRFARESRVFFVEEPIFEDSVSPELRKSVCERTNVNVVTPFLPEQARLTPSEWIRPMLEPFFISEGLENYLAWYYTPMALSFAGDCRKPEVVVYDCMDELSMFRGASPELTRKEECLLKLANLVFTGGVSLFEAKRSRHLHVHAFPSGVDVDHFYQARMIKEDAKEQSHLPKPRIGYAGVIDERIDLGLLRKVAELRPEWQLIMVGPVVKIDPETLPRAANIHWLGMQDYKRLPEFFAGWDISMMPFAINDATRFISPTKTPEYLAAGLPVVSTPIRDVVRPYGDLGLARIVHNAEEFVVAAEQSLSHGMTLKWRERSDAFLQTLSWERTFNEMRALIAAALRSEPTNLKVQSVTLTGDKFKTVEARGV
jgi:UDP-galactopyranose mutase